MTTDTHPADRGATTPASDALGTRSVALRAFADTLGSTGSARCARTLTDSSARF